MMSLMTACAAVGPTAAVIGAAASVTSAYWSWTDEEVLNVIAPECLWFRDLNMNDPGILKLTRENKIIILSNSENSESNCKTAGSPSDSPKEVTDGE